MGAVFEFIGDVFEPILEFLSLAPERPETPQGPRATDTKHTLQQTDYPRTRIYGRDLVGGSLVSFRSHPAGTHDSFTQIIALNDAPSNRMDYIWIDTDRLRIGQRGNPGADDDFRPADEEYPGIYPGLEDWYVPRINGPKVGDKYIPLVNGARRWLFAFKWHNGSQTVADSRLAAIAPGSWWGSSYVGRGISYAGVTWRSDSEVGFGQRMPEIAFEGEWTRNIYDWRTGTFQYTNNAVLCFADWLRWEYGPFQQVDSSFAQSLLVAASFHEGTMQTEANVADELVALKSGGQSARYTVNGAITANSDPERTIQQFLLAMGGGALCMRANQWLIRTGRVRQPVMALTPADYAFPTGGGEGAKSLRTRRRHPTHARFNTVTGKCNDGRPGQSFEETPYKEVSAPALVTQDGGRRIPTTIDFDLVSGNNALERAQRLANHQLQRHRNEITHTAPFKFTGGTPPGPWRLEPLDVITLEDPELWTGAKEFWIKSKRYDNQAGITHLTLREHNNFWDWDVNLVEEIELGTDTLVYDGRLDQVTGLSALTIAGSAYTKADGALWTKQQISWNAHPNAVVQQRGSYRIRWKQTSNGTYRNSILVDGALVSHTIDVQNNVAYDIGIRAFDPDGNGSHYTQIVSTPNDPQSGPEGPPSSTGLGQNMLRDSHVRYDFGVVWGNRVTSGTISGTITRDPTVGFHGTGALHMQIDSGTVDSWQRVVDQTYYPVLPGQILAFGATGRRELSKPGRYKIKALWYDGNRTLLDTKVVQDRSPTSISTGFGPWVDVGSPVMVPGGGTAFMRFEIQQWVVSGGFPQIFEFDSMRLEKTNRIRGQYNSTTTTVPTTTWVNIASIGDPAGGNLRVRGEVDIRIAARVNTQLEAVGSLGGVRSWVEVALVRSQAALAGDSFNQMIEGPIRTAELSGASVTGDKSNWQQYVFDLSEEAVPAGDWVFRVLARLQPTGANITGYVKDRSMRLEIEEASMSTAAG